MKRNKHKECVSVFFFLLGLLVYRVVTFQVARRNCLNVWIVCTDLRKIHAFTRSTHISCHIEIAIERKNKMEGKTAHSVGCCRLLSFDSYSVRINYCQVFALFLPTRIFKPFLHLYCTRQQQQRRQRQQQNRRQNFILT